MQSCFPAKTIYSMVTFSRAEEPLRLERKFLTIQLLSMLNYRKSLSWINHLLSWATLNLSADRGTRLKWSRITLGGRESRKERC